LPELVQLRSYLYAPGSRPAVMEKALHAGADAVVLDLEDAVAPGEKQAAREAVTAFLCAHAHDAPCPMHVRVNRDWSDDLNAVAIDGLSAVRVPKAEAASELVEIASRLEGSQTLIYPIVETARGVAACGELAAAPRVARLCFGATDFLADIGAPGDPDGPATLHARGALVLWSRVAGIGAPVDSVHTALDDEAGLRRSAQAGRAFGFVGKSVIHPRQLGPVNEVFTPTASELERARRVIAAGGGGGSSLDGEFIDPAVVARARATLALAGEVNG
jgi:citrate lyase subunit beta/citryl-CoA lyase